MRPNILNVQLNFFERAAIQMFPSKNKLQNVLKKLALT